MLSCQCFGQIDLHYRSTKVMSENMMGCWGTEGLVWVADVVVLSICLRISDQVIRELSSKAISTDTAEGSSSPMIQRKIDIEKVSVMAPIMKPT